MKIVPTLGIMSTPRVNSPAFGKNQGEAFAEIITFAKRMHCNAYVFHPLEIDWTKKEVWGYSLNSRDDDWERLIFPMPAVIYNRIPNRTFENRDDIRDALGILKKLYGPKFFNPGFLDKWRTHAILSNNKQTREFLPKTVRLTGPKILAEMLNKYKSVYLKPCANSLGNDVFKVTLKDNRYCFIHQNLNSKREGAASNCNHLLSELSGDKSGYLIQQNIKLAKYRGRPFDLRFLVQKDRNGEWRKTGVAARIAGKGSITTHVFYGGSRSPAKNVIKAASKKSNFSSNHVLEQLNQVGILVAKALENAYGENFGELEMDLGIDSSGKVWFIEANSKPFKFDEPLIRAKSLIRLIDYVLYLDKQ